METKSRSKYNQEFESNWAQWIMETAYRWEDLSDVIKMTGIDKVDNDHKILSEYAIEFNRLFDFTGKGGFDLDFINAMEKLFAQLFSFTKEHFTREQEIIERLGIPGLRGQMNQHTKILKMLEDYMEEINTGKLNIALKFKSTFMDWLANHINNIDYNTFRLDKIGPIVLSKAQSWEDAADLIRSMGMVQIDEDHRHLTELALEFNQLIESETDLSSNKLREQSLDKIRRLSDFAAEHFSREEQIIEQYQLPMFEEQQAEHQKILIKFKTYETSIEKGELLDLQELKSDILEWWVTHINLRDFNTFKSDDWVLKILSEAKTWDDIEDLVFKTNIHFIDQQHRIQTEYILEMNSYLENLAKKKVDEQTYNWIIAQSEKIYQFAEKHFEDEERVLQEMKPVNMAAHVTEHMALLDKIQEYIENVKSGRVLISLKLKTLFANWWINHINHIDYESFKNLPTQQHANAHVMPADQI